MIRFKYNMSDDLAMLVHQTIADYTADYLYGALPEGYAGQLQNTSLYLVCEFNEYDNRRKQVYTNPLVVVARNEASALATYSEVMDGKIGTTMLSIVDGCENLKVETID